jgi:hypothetical protein
MISFGEFCAEKDLRECATFIAKLDVDPVVVMENILEPELFNEIFGGLGRAFKAAGQVAGSLYSGGLKHGVAQAADTVSGPAVKFDKAVAILKELEQYLRTNPATKGAPSSSMPKRSIAGYIQVIYKALEKEASSMPKMLAASQQMAAGKNYAMRGGPGLNRPPRQAAQPQQAQVNPSQQANPNMRLAQ